MRLVVCRDCERHVKIGDPACPFCGASLEGLSPRTLGPAPVTRAAAVFLGAVAVAGCGKTDTPRTAPDAAFGPPERIPTAEVVAPYGAPPVPPPDEPPAPPPPPVDAGPEPLRVPPYGAPPRRHNRRKF